MKSSRQMYSTSPTVGSVSVDFVFVCFCFHVCVCVCNFTVSAHLSSQWSVGVLCVYTGCQLLSVGVPQVYHSEKTAESIILLLHYFSGLLKCLAL